MTAITVKSGDPLLEFLLRMGDNSLVLGHRLSEWCGHTPVLEEDIAIANVSLDLVGQTQLWLGFAGEVEGKGHSADNLAYLRDAGGFRNFLLVEQPNGSYGQTLMRQFLFDAWHYYMLRRLEHSSDRRIAEIAEKAVKEVTYHLERSVDLVIRLGDGTQESHALMQEALELLWPYTGQMFDADGFDEVAVKAGIMPDPAEIRPDWDAQVTRTLRAATLEIPQEAFSHKVAARSIHTEHLGYILADMQFLQRAYPGATW
ncbi:MAG: phenylacetate-CoA oxygenase subunit PaaC [Salaquimonas sp.]|jgi:ring-1,2-phenylacetyl-CoA epoxidase subunit PaaC|nr:phenylacetate-CoA oxygenase subunit PaaC [Salaquimonas sp.]